MTLLAHVTTAALTLGILGIPVSARADVLLATRDQPMAEVAHSVDIQIADGVATYRVRRVFSNPGKVADQVELMIDLPFGAAATGLRIRANERWYDGVLMERDKAAALYQEMTGFGSAVAKDPALLAWVWADKLSLQVFPVMPGTVSTVEYTLTAPTRYEGGRYFVSYPRLATTPAPGAAPDEGDEVPRPAGNRRALPLAVPVVTVSPAWGGSSTAIEVDGTRVARDTSIVLLQPPRPDWLDQINASPEAGYVASTIVIPASSHTTKLFDKATISLELPHTYKGDLEVMLLTPTGAQVPVHTRDGGDANDLRGTYTLDLPAGGVVGAGAWRLVVSDHAALDTGTLDRWSLTLGTGKDQTIASSADTPLFVPDAPESPTDGGVATIAVTPPPITTWQARLGRVVASSEHAFSRLEVDVAPQLVPTPRRAQVVFVLDASHSMEAAGVDAQLEMIRAYTTHVPDAEVEIVTYRRRAQRVFGRFVDMKSLGDAIATARARGAFAPGNGSALDEGARLASSLLAGRQGPRRMVLTTDELVRDALTPALATSSLAKLPADVVVHVVVPQLDQDDRPRLARRDDAPLAPLATRHHGIFVDLHGLPAQSHKALVPAVLELVRPTRIENLVIRGIEIEPGMTPSDDVLREGAGLRIMVPATSAPATVTLTGTLWSDPIRKEVRVSRPFSRATAAFVFGADAHHGLSDTEQRTLAMFGKAVSPVTSYVAAEPGVRPSTIGFEHVTGGLLGGFGFGMSGFGAGGGGAAGLHHDWRRLIGTGSCVDSVRPSAAWSVALDIETSYDEILDVAIAGAGSPMARCLAEVVWELRLDRAEFSRATARESVTLSGPAAR